MAARIEMAIDPTLSRREQRDLMAARFFVESPHWEDVAEYLRRNPDTVPSQETRMGLATYQKMKADYQKLVGETVTPEVTAPIHTEIEPGEAHRQTEHRIERTQIRERLKSLRAVEELRGLTAEQEAERVELEVRLGELAQLDKLARAKA